MDLVDIAHPGGYGWKDKLYGPRPASLVLKEELLNIDRPPSVLKRSAVMQDVGLAVEAKGYAGDTIPRARGRVTSYVYGHGRRLVLNDYPVFNLVSPYFAQSVARDDKNSGPCNLCCTWRAAMISCKAFSAPSHGGRANA